MGSKRCYECGVSKDVTEFPVNRKRSDGRGTLCKACKKIYNAAYYERTKDRHNPGRAARRRRAIAEARRNVYEYLQAHPCVDCGETDIVVLDFDHQRDKRVEINKMIDAGLAWGTILAEIAKCEVVCSNDHRRRTAAKFGWARVLFQASLAQLVEPRTLNPKSLGSIPRRRTGAYANAERPSSKGGGCEFKSRRAYSLGYGGTGRPARL